MKPHLSATVLGLVFLIFAGHTSTFAQTLNAGTLRCTLSAGIAESPNEPRELSCVFKPLVGIEASYSGHLNKFHDSSQTADAPVLVWSVFAEKVPLPIRAIEGRYAGTIDTDTKSGKPSGRLIGGLDSSIELRPLTRLPNSGSDGAPLALELDLKSVKA